MSAGLRPDMTIRAALDHVASELAASGIDDPRREARLTVSAALGLDLAALITREREELGAKAPDLTAILARRASERAPLSRILGRREFFGLDLLLSPETLDPRPDTECLVEAVLAELAADGRRDAHLSLLDLGTGTGAILLALLKNLPNAAGEGIDIAPGAVAIARANAEALGLSDRAEFRVGDIRETLAGRYDIIVSNPPYIPSGDIAGLDPEVRLHDPLRALDGGPDGLDFYRRIASAAPGLLKSGGFLALEIGMGQAEDVSALLAAAGFAGLRRFRDLAGIERVLLCRAA